MDTSRAITTRHNLMVNKISDEIGPGMPEWTTFLNIFLNHPLSTNAIGRVDSVQKLFGELSKHKTYEEGDYKEVINLLEAHGTQFNKIVEIMKQCQKYIEDKKNATENQRKSDDNKGTSQQSVDKPKVPTADGNTGTRPQRDTRSSSPEIPQQMPTADGLSSNKYPTNYLKREVRGKKGLMVIFNFTFKDRVKSERPHAAKDKKYLKDFFEDELEWDVEYHEDYKKNKLEAALKTTQTMLKEDKYNDGQFKYYCLFVVVMSHGEEEYFLTSDNKKFKYADVFSEFTNEKIREFAGRPKVFLMQSCKGTETQNQIRSDHVQDRCPILDDSDILVIWATTPGCKAFGHPEEGSFLIEVTIKHFQQKFASDDVENMLSGIRRNIAYDPKYRSTKDQERDPYRQMPCTWSTLTDKLYLIRYTSLLGKRRR